MYTLLSTHLINIANFAALTFGRDAAQFKQLVTFLAILSVVLWTVVLFSTLLRFASQLIFRPRKPQPVAADIQTEGVSDATS